MQKTMRTKEVWMKQTAPIEGFVSDRFADLRSALAKQVASYPGGAAVSVYHRGKLVADLWGGARNMAGDPWQRDTMSVSFSTTKGVASTAIHMLADRGQLEYDKPIAMYWPEFAQNGKDKVTVRHLLCHESGLYDVRSLVSDVRELLDWNRMTELLAKARPAHAPGERSAYHALTYGYLTGEIVRRVSGKSFSAFVDEEIAKPLNLDGFYVGVPEGELPRVAQLIRKSNQAEVRTGKRRGPSLRARLITRGIQSAFKLTRYPADLRAAQAALAPHGIGKFDFSSPEVVQACIPAANGVFTARSLARFYACLANGGELDGVRLLSEDTVRRAIEIQSSRPDYVVIFPMRWRMGFHVVATPRGISKNAFGHFGYGGSGAWAHPKHKLSFAMTVNSGHGTPFGDFRMVRMTGIVLRGARR
jgi:CubicO group peptidase (beta-lactamase class C family)